MAEKVALATQDVVVHTLVDPTAEPAKDLYGNDSYDVEARVLLPGESVPVDSLPPYLRKRLDNGTCEGLTQVTQQEAEKILADAAMVREALGGRVVPAPGQSHSDYLVPDSVRTAALRARAEAEGGDGGGFSAVEADANPAAGAAAHAEFSGQAPEEAPVEETPPEEPAPAEEKTAKKTDK